MRSKVDDAVPELPAAASVPEYADSSTKASALIVGLTWTREDEPHYAIMGRLAATLEDRLRAIPGTETVDIFGEPDEEIRVDIAASELSRLGLSAALSQQITASDAKVAAGQYRSDSSEFLLEVNSNLSSLEQICNLPITAGIEGQVARLGDIATVTKAVQNPPPDLALVNGRGAIALSAKVESAQRLDQWAVQAHRVLDDFRRELPDGLDLQVVLDQSQYVQQRLNGVVSNLVTGSALVIGVSLVMLGFKAALLVGLALPLTTLMVFGLMDGLGVPLHQMSVTGIIIALGLLIDNAIITVDEAQIRLRQGMPPREAVAETVRHLVVPLLASTLTTVLAFIPIASSPGGVGEFIGTIGLTVILALGILMTATLVLSFNSFGLAALIGTVAILAVGLAALALKLFGSIFGFTAILGTLGLIGLAINDSIVVLAALREHPEARLGHPQPMADVVFQATRHVIATTVTTIIGFVPLMVDPSGFWPPLAIAIAGGLSGATLLALYYIPSMYRLLSYRRPVSVSRSKQLDHCGT